MFRRKMLLLLSIGALIPLVDSRGAERVLPPRTVAGQGHDVLAQAPDSTGPPTPILPPRDPAPLGTNPLSDLREAKHYWDRIKASNREALRQANRQPQPRLSHAPNIVLIVADDLGFGDLGAYALPLPTALDNDALAAEDVAGELADGEPKIDSQPRIGTPNIDRMAADGVRFEQYYAGSSLGVPGNCSLLTGLHTGHCAIRGDAPKDQKVDVYTVAEGLWQAGYTTGMIGRWALGDYTPEATPNSQGYDYSYGYLNNEQAKIAYPEILFRDGQRVDIVANQREKRQSLADSLFKDEAIDFIHNHRRRPFFLHVGFVSPRAALPALPNDSPYKNRPWTEDQKRYADLVHRLDGYVGEILETIRRLELDRRTIVFFTSDNGPPENEVTRFFKSARGLRGGKGTLYEGGIRAPMIVWGRRFTSGAKVSTPAAAWDFFPTALELAEAWRRPRNLDGVHLLRLLSGESKAIHDNFYWELHAGGFSQSTRSEQWKGVDPAPRVGTELYDLVQDAPEQGDIASLQAANVKKHTELKQRAHAPNPLWPAPGD